MVNKNFARNNRLHSESYHFENKNDNANKKSEIERSTDFTSLDEAIDTAVEEESYVLRAIRSNQSAGSQSPKKKLKRGHLTPITFARVNARNGKFKPITVKALIDSGGSLSMWTKASAAKLRVKTTPTTVVFSTMGGEHHCTEKVKTHLTLPEFHDDRLIEWEFHLADNLGIYDMIIGRDMMEELGIDVHFSKSEVEWDQATIPMRDPMAPLETSYHVQESGHAADMSERVKSILDAKYEKADLREICNNQRHLNQKEQQELYQLLRKHETLFDGTLGKWNGEPYEIELQEGAKPYHARPYPIPKTYEQTLKMEVQRLCDIGVLKKVNRSEWGAPTFIIPKKDGTVRFINDFRELNKRIKRKPYPIPKIQDLLLKLEGFQYATSLDLNMGYYHIELSPNSKRLCTIVLPWGKYEMQRLPMGLCNSPDIFQERMGSLFEDLEFVRVYIDDVLSITKGDFSDHLEKLEVIFDRLQQTGLKINATKSFFARDELEYLGYWVTREGIQPVAKKVEAIHAMAPPKTKRELRKFIGVVNYYRDMWIRRSEVLAPLTALTSKQSTWQWGEEQQKAFETMKRIISTATLLAYPNFNEPFEIHTDASHTQLGSVISQHGKPIAFYSRKLNPAQTRYTTTERELLAIVETLKEFRNILLGQRLKVYTDHKNLTYKEFNTERVMRWRLLIEEFGPELVYIKGESNVVADALSRLDLNDKSTTQEAHLHEFFGADELPEHSFPLTYKEIAQGQNNDPDLLQKVRNDSSYSIKIYRGGGKNRELIVRDDRIVLPSSLQKRCVRWYHEMLCHPGETRTEQTIRQHFFWKNLRKDVEDICKKCEICQLTKRKTIKYGHLPPKEAESEPWEVLCVDLIGPYKIRNIHSKKDLELWCLTMIDPATGWFEMVRIPKRDAFTVAQLAEYTWFTRYPWPQQIIYDRGTEFMGEFRRMVQEDYGITTRPITSRNPQANSILERVHQTIGNMFRTCQVQYSEDTDPIDGVLAACMFAVRATYHTTTQATPSQLVFGRDAILNTKFVANWKHIKERKTNRILKNNKQENQSRKPYQYHVGQKVLVRNEQSRKYGVDPYQGPYEIVHINNNGSIRIRKGHVQMTYNIRNLHPWQE